MKTTKILIIGDSKWASGLEENLATADGSFHFEIISDEDAAEKRLEHNSYDILLLEDGFMKKRNYIRSDDGVCYDKADYHCD